MKEAVLEFSLNLKKVRFNSAIDKPVKATLNVTSSGEVKAKDIKVAGGITVANPEIVLANLSKGAKLNVDMEVSTGVGYSPFEEREKEGIGTIAIDAIF